MYTEITCRASDAHLFRSVWTGGWEQRPAPVDTTPSVDPSVNPSAVVLSGKIQAYIEGRGLGEIIRLAEAGVEFIGWHVAHGFCHSACLAGFGGKFHEAIRVEFSDLPCATVRKNGEVSEWELANAREYLKAASEVEKKFGMFEMESEGGE